jgi:hypothetical protein
MTETIKLFAGVLIASLFYFAPALIFFFLQLPS